MARSSHADKDLENGSCGSDSPLPDLQPQPAQVDPALEKRIVRKLDRHIIPLVMFLCMLPTAQLQTHMADTH